MAMSMTPLFYNICDSQSKGALFGMIDTILTYEYNKYINF